MLDGLLGRSGFSSKCKSLIKPTRTRIEVLRRRAEATQRFLKEDLAKLLANGLDVNAYGRTEEFIAGLNLLSCYSFIDQSCEYILKQLSVMQKLGQCPEECRETVASLMFAAARFSDLPELRDLRDVFQERYGNGLECYVNQVFVEKLASKPPAVEKRIKLLQDIAAEFSIQWDSKGFKQRMDKSSTLAQGQAKKLGPVSVADDKYKLPEGNNVFRKIDPCSKERIEHAHEEPKLHNDGIVHARRKEVMDIPYVGRDQKRSKERIEHAHEGPMLHNDGIVHARRKEGMDVPYVGRDEKRSKERIEHAHEGPMLHNDGIVHARRKEGMEIPYVGRDEKRSKERIDHVHNAAMLLNDSNANVRRKEVDIPYVGRDGKHSKGRIEHAHQAAVLHNDGNVNVQRKEVMDIPYVGRVEKHSNERIEHAHDAATLHGDGNVNVRRKEVLDVPLVGREEKRGYKHEGFISKAENDGHFLKAKLESASENNDAPLMMKSSGGSHHDRRRPEVFDDARVHRGRKEKHGYNQQPGISMADTMETGDNDDHLFRGRQEFHAKKHGSSSSRDRKPENIDNDHLAPFLKGDSNGRSHPFDGDGEVAVKATGKVQEEEVVRLKSSLPPPYVKSNIPPPYSKPSVKHTALGSDDTILNSLPGAGGNNAERIHKKQGSPYHRSSDDLVSNSDRSKKEVNDGVGEDGHYQNSIPLPKPRSIRRKHSKSSSSHDDVGSSEDGHIVKRISSSRRKERKGLQILFDDEHYHKDEEEKMMDKLLLHYSKKASAYDVGKLRKKKSRSNRSQSPHDRSNDEAAPPTRSISLPHDQSGESETKKVYERANSFQPDNQARHVHPKLPDYEDLAARFAALRGG